MWNSIVEGAVRIDQAVEDLVEVLFPEQGDQLFYQVEWLF